MLLDEHLAPEYISSRPLSEKSIRFWLRVLLLALVSDQRMLELGKASGALHSKEGVMLKLPAEGRMDTAGWKWRAGHGRVFGVLLLLLEHAMAADATSPWRLQQELQPQHRSFHSRQ